MSEDEHFASIATVGNLGLVKIESRPSSLEQDISSPARFHVRFTCVLDNSGSMGSLTKEATVNICTGLLRGNATRTSNGNKHDDEQNFEVSSNIVIFDTRATIVGEAMTNPADVANIAFPPQGTTNITCGIETGMQMILNDASQAKKKTSTQSHKVQREEAVDILHCLIFLSDGGHNSGEVLNEKMIRQMRSQVDASGVKLAVMVVGIGSNDTRLGMMVKNGLETLRMDALESVYFAKNSSEMKGVLDELLNGVSVSLTAGSSQSFELFHHPSSSSKIKNSIKKAEGEEDVYFMETMTNKITKFVAKDGEVYLPIWMGDAITKKKDINEHEEQKATATTQTTNSLLGTNEGFMLLMNGRLVPLRQRRFTAGDITLMINTLMPQLSRSRVAYGQQGIQKQLNILNAHLNVADEILRLAEEAQAESKWADPMEAIPRSAECVSQFTGKQRTLVLKQQAKKLRHRFAEERNKLASLEAVLGNDSASQAAFLTGKDRKYAGKAMLRTAEMGAAFTVESVISQLLQMKPKLVECLGKDAAIQRATDENGVNSVLSLMNTTETLSEWVNLLEMIDTVDQTSLFSLIVTFSMVGHPVLFEKTNAAQMAPLQTRCLKLEPTGVDTGSICFAKKQGFLLRGQMGQDMEQTVVFVDPACPNTSLLVMKDSPICKINGSINLCDDLYMVHPEQILSQHVHCFIKAVQLFTHHGNFTRAYAELAMKILYSLRKFYAPQLPAKFIKLFHHWFFDFGTVTTAEDDGCEHAMLLPVLLGIVDETNSKEASLPSAGNNAATKTGCDWTLSALGQVHPLKTLINEHLARTSRIRLGGYAKSKSRMDTTSERTEMAHLLLRQLYGIDESNSPQPLTDVMLPEPSAQAVRESCTPYIDTHLFTANSKEILKKELSVENGVEDFVGSTILPAMHAYSFSKSLRRYMLLHELTWEKLIQKMEYEVGCPSAIIEHISQEMKSEFSPAGPSSTSSSEKMASRTTKRKDPNNSTADEQIFNNEKANGLFSALAMALQLQPETIKNHSTSNNVSLAKSSSSSSLSTARLHKIIEAMFCQALLHHESETRKGVIDVHDVCDPETHQEMIITLRMGVYFDACKIKRVKWLAVVGDVTYAEALACDVLKFQQMLGVHTHGLTKQVFWSMLRACEDDEVKQDEFVSLSNHTVTKISFRKMLSKSKTDHQ